MAVYYMHSPSFVPLSGQTQTGAEGPANVAMSVGIPIGVQGPVNVATMSVGSPSGVKDPVNGTMSVSIVRSSLCLHTLTSDCAAYWVDPHWSTYSLWGQIWRTLLCLC